MTHLIGEQLKVLAGIDMQHIVYRGGTPAMTDLIAGHLPLSFATVAQALQVYKGGQIRAIAVSSDTRYASVPEIPTFKEQGIDVVANEWYGLLAPAGTPKPIIEKLNTEMKRIMALPGMGDRLAAIELMATTPEELTTYHEERDRSLGRADPAAGVEGGSRSRSSSWPSEREPKRSATLVIASRRHARSMARIGLRRVTTSRVRRRLTKSDPETAACAGRADSRRTPSAGRARPARRRR